MKNYLSWALAAATGIALFVADAQQQSPQASGKAPPKGAVDGRLAWFDRQGKIVGGAGEPGLYRTLTISRDGKKAAVEYSDAQTRNWDIWLLDVASGGMTRFTTDPAWEAFPTWSPDGRRIIFTSNRSGTYDLYEKAVTGGGEEKVLYQSMEGKGPNSWSPDGKYLIYYSLGQPTHLRLLSIDGPPDRKSVPIVDPQSTSITGRFSPDGRWILYTSNESGSTEVSVRPFDSAKGSVGEPIVVTHGGGRTPLWRGDGKEIFYMGPDGMATALEVKTAPAFRTGTPRPLFAVPTGVLFWDVTPDGKRFLMPVTAS